MPCSLPNVTNEPVSETTPMSTVTATTTRVQGLSLCADLDERHERRGAAADAVERRDELRHLGHLHPPCGEHGDHRADHDGEGDESRGSCSSTLSTYGDARR